MLLRTRRLERFFIMRPLQKWGWKEREESEAVGLWGEEKGAGPSTMESFFVLFLSFVPSYGCSTDVDLSGAYRYNLYIW